MSYILVQFAVINNSAQYPNFGYATWTRKARQTKKCVKVCHGMNTRTLRRQTCPDEKTSKSLTLQIAGVVLVLRCVAESKKDPRSVPPKPPWQAPIPGICDVGNLVKTSQYILRGLWCHIVESADVRPVFTYGKVSYSHHVFPKTRISGTCQYPGTKIDCKRLPHRLL